MELFGAFTGLVKAEIEDIDDPDLVHTVKRVQLEGCHLLAMKNTIYIRKYFYSHIPAPLHSTFWMNIFEGSK